MINLLFIIFLLLGSRRLFILFQRLRRQSAGVGWWFAFGFIIICGAVLGTLCSFYFQYSLEPRFRIGGFPFPLVFFQLEDGIWTDFRVPEFQAWLTILANIITFILLATLPLWLATWRWQKPARHSDCV